MYHRHAKLFNIFIQHIWGKWKLCRVKFPEENVAVVTGYRSLYVYEPLATQIIVRSETVAGLIFQRTSFLNVFRGCTDGEFK